MEGCQLKKIVSKAFSKFKQSRSNGARHIGEVINNSLIDMGFFKKSILLYYLQLYTSKKKWTHVQRFFFIAVALLFFVFGIMILDRTAIIPFGFFFEGFVFIKNSINGLCFLLAAVASAAAWHTKPEKEAREYLIQKIEQNMNVLSNEAQLEVSELEWIENETAAKLPFFSKENAR